MMSRSSRWVSGIGAVVLSGGVLLANTGFVDPAGAIPLESWDDKIPNATQRFKVLQEFSSAAVLDKETGLVWEKQPVTLGYSWQDARVHCTDTILGNRKGWRLPSVHELASLIDPSVSPGLTLPVGHPFTDVQSANYWSATANADNPSNAWFVHFGNGVVFTTDKAFGIHAWCVRGGMNADQY